MSTDNTQGTQAAPVAESLPSGAPNGNTADSGGGGSSSSSSQDWDMDPDVRAALDFDPFTPSDEETDADADTTTTNTDGTPSAEGQPSAAQPASAQQAPNQQGGAQQQPAQAPNDIQTLIEKQTQLLNAVVNGNKPATQTEAQPEADPWKHVPEYNYTVPEALVTALNSEDAVERQRALGLAMQGVSRATHQTVLAQVAPIIQQLKESLPAAIQQILEYQSVKQTTQTEFYTKYPQLNQPALKPLIGRVAQDIMTKGNISTWSPELGDEIAKQVGTILAAASGQPMPVAAPQVNPPAMFGGNNGVGARPAVNGKKTQADHIQDLFK